MSTYERLVSELGDGLGFPLAPDSSGSTEIFVEGRALILRADETGERELLVFTAVASAPDNGFSTDVLKRALAMNLFGREVVGHHLGLFADMLLLSSTLPIADLDAEGLADRLILLARIAGQIADSLATPDSEPAELPFDPKFMSGLLV